MARYSLIVAAIAVGAAGCTLEPKYERPAAPVAASFPTGGIYDAQPGPRRDAAREHPANQQPATSIGWRDFLADGRLQRLVEIALLNNRDLRVAVMNIEAAQAQYQITRSSLFPQVSAAANETRSRTLSALGRPTTSLYSVGINAAWELDFFGRIRSLNDQALAQYLATAESRKATEILLVSSVADQYLTMLALDEQIAITQETLKSTAESYRIVKLKFDTGAGSELDLQQSEGLLEQAQANLQAQFRLRAQAENALVLLIGEPLPADLPPARPLDDQALLTDIPAGLPSDLLERRPDIAAAEQTLLAANADIGAARAAFFPRITLTGSYGTLSTSLSDLFGAGSAGWSFGPQISVPIFAGGANVANLDLAKVRKRIEIAHYEKAIQTAFREVADGLAARGTYDSQVEHLERYTASQSRRLALSNVRYNTGVDSYLNVLTAQTDLYAAQQSLITSRLQRLTNLVDLYRALGGGWIERTGEQPRPADAPAA